MVNSPVGRLKPVSDKPAARILIVDDDLRNRELLEVMLAPDGYRLQMAASGEEALAIVAQQPPDLILLDVMMPGLDGCEVARRLKNDPATEVIPIVMVTALGEREAKIQGLTVGAEDFLTKPVDRAELRMRVRNLLRLKAYGEHFDQYSQLLEGEVTSRTAELFARTQTLERVSARLSEQAALLDLVHGAVIVRCMQNRIVFWSRGAEALYGWTSEEAVGQVGYELLRAEYGEPFDAIYAALLRDGHWEGEPIHYTREGARLVVDSQWTLQRGADGAPARILTINHDITDSRQAETERRVLLERLSLATAVARVGVWELDVASDALTLDETMCRIYGWPPGSGKTHAEWSAAVHPEDLEAMDATLQKVIRDREPGKAEFRIRLPDGSIRNISAVEGVVLDASGNASRVIGVNVDVTAQREAEKAQEQVRADQLRFKDEFLSHVSHELRSPLTAIKQFTAIVGTGLAGELNNEQGEYMQIVLKNVRQLQSMIDDLLEVTRLETHKLTVEPESVSVPDAITYALEALQGTAHAKGVTLSQEAPGDVSPAYADQARLRQILVILIDNAVKFTPAGGEVKVKARVHPENPQLLLMEVSDTGCGIGREATERIFERLYQVRGNSPASRQGLGLGLYICKDLVTRQGGQIWAKSEPGSGSVFSFTLPVFSLTSLIAPLLTSSGWPADSVALIAVEARVSPDWPSPIARAEWSRDARSLLQRCLLPDLDVLLPSRNSDGKRQLFFIAAFADIKGAGVLANRIRDQFERMPHLKRPGLTVDVVHMTLGPSHYDTGLTTEEILLRMSRRLEQAVQLQLISEKAA